MRNVYNNLEIGKKEYEVVIFAENDNFIKEIGELYLTDLDFSELSHTWSSDKVVNSWTQTWGQGYYYPLIDYGFDYNYQRINGRRAGLTVETRQMLPSTNVKYILDKMFSDANYNYQSNFFESDVFKDLYIPFNRTSLERVDDENSKFSIGMIAPVTKTFSGTFADILNLPNYGNQIQVGIYKIPFDNETSPFGDPGGFYNTSTYVYEAQTNSPSQRFVCDFDISFQYLRKTDLTELTANNIPTTYIAFRRSKNPLTGVDVPGGYYMTTNNSTTALGFTEDYIDNISITGPDIAQDGTNPIRVKGQIFTDMLDGSTPERRALYPGEKVYVEIKYSCSGVILAGVAQPTANKNLVTFNEPNVFFNNLDINVQPGEFYDYNIAIPKNIKQKDFFNSLVKMFNLYIEPSKEYDRTLVIEPRDQYYEAGDVKDWTKKLDISQEIQEDILGETQDLKTIFKYRDDTDFYNVDYREFKAGISYGQFEYEIDNDFVTGEKRVEPIFSPTPLVPIVKSPKIVIPKIGKVDNNNIFSPFSHNIRILTKHRSSVIDSWSFDAILDTADDGFAVLSTTGISDITHNFSANDVIKITNSGDSELDNKFFKIIEIIDTKEIKIDIFFDELSGTTSGDTISVEGLQYFDSNQVTWGFDGEPYNVYPYLGHFNDPFNPAYDLNYGQTVGLYYPEKSVTDDNLFSVYWQNYMDEISDNNSKIITAYFYLTPDDIANFKFSDNIFVDNQYYKVNKIEYDPTRVALSKVELIKSIIITVPKQFSASTPPRLIDTVSNNGLNPIRDLNNGTGNINTSWTNNVETTDTGVFGNNNNTSNSGGLIAGNGNQVSGNGNNVFGSDNTVQNGTNDVFVVGNNNTVNSGVNDTLVFGSNLNVTDDNVFVVGLPIVNAPNYISAGRNEVINDNIAKDVNYISGSRDAVREIGSDDPINIVSGGRFV